MKLTLQKVEFFFGVGGVGGGGRAEGAESVSAFMHRRGCGFSSRSDADYLEARDWKEVQRQWSLYFPPDTKKNGKNRRGFLAEAVACERTRAAAAAFHTSATPNENQIKGPRLGAPLERRADS